MKDLKELQKHVVFLPVDKVRHDCPVMCKASYCKLLKNEMEGNHLLYLPCLLWSEKKNRIGKLNHDPAASLKSALTRSVNMDSKSYKRAENRIDFTLVVRKSYIVLIIKENDMRKTLSLKSLRLLQSVPCKRSTGLFKYYLEMNCGI